MYRAASISRWDFWFGFIDLVLVWEVCVGLWFSIARITLYFVEAWSLRSCKRAVLVCVMDMGLELGLLYLD